MLAHVRGIDHAVILVRDLDLARDTYARLGFTLTPRGFHSLGSQNHCIMFGRDYLELMALPAAPPAAFQYFADFLSKGEGVGALALATEDVAAAYAELTQAGIAAEAPLALSRPVGNLGEARFTLVQLPPAETPGFRTFLCQHHTREIVWRPEYQRHANGVGGIGSVSVATPDPVRYARLFEGLPVGYAHAKASAVAAIRLRVGDKNAAADSLQRGGFSPIALKGGALAVGADQAHGILLVFE
ncbi:MAG TPA: VOC family protein [Burkholderiales bacterium]|nr:VOC family protein [Burkholderiales bacterium]